MNYFLIIGIIAIIFFTTRACIKLRNKERFFSSIKTVREVLQLEIGDFKDFLSWLLGMNDYSITGGKVIGEYEIILNVIKDKEKRILIAYKRAPNHLVSNNEMLSFKEKYLKNDKSGMIITTSDFDQDVRQVDKHNPLIIRLISGSDLQKMLEKRPLDNPF